MSTDQQEDLLMVGVVTEAPTTKKVGSQGSVKSFFKLNGQDGTYSYSQWGNDFFEQVNQGDTVTVHYYESPGTKGGAPFRNVNSFEKGASENDNAPSAVSPVEPAIPDVSTMRGWEPPMRPSASPTATPGTMLLDHPTKRESIERQVALGHALNWIHNFGDRNGADEILQVAEKFYHWVSQKGYAGVHPHFCDEHQLFYDGTSAKGNKYHVQDGQYCVEGREGLITLPGGET